MLGIRRTRTFFLLGIFLLNPVIAAESKKEQPLDPQSPEAIKKMADQLEAERKARELELQKKKEEQVRRKEEKEKEEEKKAQEEEERKKAKHYPVYTVPHATPLPSGAD